MVLMAKATSFLLKILYEDWVSLFSNEKHGEMDEEGGGALYPDREVPRSCSCLSIYDLEHESNQNSPKMCCSSIILLYQYKWAWI